MMVNPFSGHEFILTIKSKEHPETFLKKSKVEVFEVYGRD